MGLGWTLGFVAAFTDWMVLWYIFIVINSLQGALLCAAFIFTRQVMRLLADCFRPLLRRVSPGTGVTSSNDLSLSKKSPTSHGSQADGTAVIRMSLEEIN